MGSVPNDDDLLQQLAAEYADQMAESLTSVENHLVNLGMSGDLSLELARLVHSMKGAGASFGIQMISTICHQFEDQLAKLSPGKPPSLDTMDRFFQYVDLLRVSRGLVLKKGLSEEKRTAEWAEIAERLNKISGKGMARILLADNTRTLSTLVEKNFEGLPVSVLVINDGLVALSRALAEPYDMVIVSGSLKNMDGCGVIAALRYSGMARIPYCVLLTSQMSDKRYTSCGADEILPKTPDGLSALRKGFEGRQRKAS